MQAGSEGSRWVYIVAGQHPVNQLRLAIVYLFIYGGLVIHWGVGWILSVKRTVYVSQGRWKSICKASDSDHQFGVSHGVR